MYYIGVDLGGTNIAVGVVNEKFEILKKGSVPTNADREADEIIRDMAELTLKLLEECGLTVDDVEYAGISTPGTAVRETGVVIYANNLPFLNYPLAAKLSEFSGIKRVLIENDANAAAKAEAYSRMRFSTISGNLAMFSMLPPNSSVRKFLSPARN